MKRIPNDYMPEINEKYLNDLLQCDSPVKTAFPGGPVVKFRFSDRPGAEEINLIFSLFDDLIDKTVKAGYFAEFYVILDFSEFTATGRAAKDLVKTKLSNYYNSGYINSVAIISPNYLIHTVGRVLTEVADKIRISFHHDETDALNLIRFNLSEEEKFEIKERNKYEQTVYRPDWIERNHIIFQGWNLPIKSRPNWMLHGNKPGAKISRFLINNNIVFAKLEGPIDSEDITASLSMYDEICEIQGKHYLGIFDFSDIHTMTKKMQKALEASNEYIDKFFKQNYVIMPWYGKAIYASYKLFSPKTVEKVNSMKNLHEALKEALLYEINYKKEHNPVQVEILSDRFLSNLSQEELIEIITGLKREIRNNQEKTETYSNELFQVLARITWDSNFVPAKLTEPDDPHFAKLYQAAQLLQDDMHEIYKTLAEYESQLGKK